MTQRGTSPNIIRRSVLVSPDDIASTAESVIALVRFKHLPIGDGAALANWHFTTLRSMKAVCSNGVSNSDKRKAMRPSISTSLESGMIRQQFRSSD
jgi:hypothetical protein